MAPKSSAPALTHRDLCLMAGRWLRSQRCSVVVVEPYSVRSPELPDAIGWRRGCETILVECKVSRSDFMADRKKLARQAGGYLGRERYFLISTPFAVPEEMPDGWGLLSVRGSRVRVEKKATPLTTGPTMSETCLLVEQLERLQDDRPMHLLPPPGRFQINRSPRLLTAPEAEPTDPDSSQSTGRDRTETWPTHHLPRPKAPRPRSSEPPATA